MKLFLSVIFILSYFSLQAQENKKDIDYIDTPLSEILSNLEERFDVKFSYNTTSFTHLNVTLQLKKVLLKEILLKLENNYNILFDKIDDRYYVVKKIKTVTLCGYIKKSDNTPIEEAIITNQTLTKGVTSNKEGFFEIKNYNETDTLSIAYIGYKTIFFPIKNIQHSGCPSYTLFVDNYALNEVVIKEYIGSGVVKTKDGSVKMNPNKQDILSGLAEPDILQGIQLLPGIESPSETASGLYIRGGSPDQNLILWDGIKLYNSDHFFGLLSAFNPYITDNVKIYRSGAKPKYGDRISGIIDISTDKKIPKKIEGGLGINMTHVDAFLKIPLSKKTGILFSTRRSITDIIPTPTFGRFVQRVFQNTSLNENQNTFDPNFSEDDGRFYFTDATLKLISHLSEKDKISISSLYTKNNLDYSFNVQGFDEGSSDKLNIENIGITSHWGRIWNPAFSSNTTLYYSEYDFVYNGSNPFLEETLVITKENNIKEFGLNFHSDLIINNAITLSNGYQFFSNQVTFLLQDNDFTARDNKKGPTHTIYSGLNYKKSKRWYLDIGVRANYYSALSDVFIEPRIYAERIFGDHFRLKGSAEIRNQAISQIIEFTTLDFGLENQVWALSNEDGLPVLKSDQLSVGFLYSKNGWNIDVDFYYKNIDGFTSLTRGFQSTSESFSEGNSEITGIDILLKKKIRKYTTWLGYTYSDTDFTFDDLNQGRFFRGNNDITHSFTWSHLYTWNKLQFSLGWKYRTGIPFTNALGIRTDDEGEFVIDYDTVNANTLPDYHRLDFSVLYNFKFSKKENALDGKLGFSILNVYSKRNLLDKSFSTVETVDDNNITQAELRELNKFSLGITPNLVFRVNF